MSLDIHNRTVRLQDRVSHPVVILPVERAGKDSLGFCKFHLALLFGFHPLIENPGFGRAYAQDVIADRINSVHALLGEMDVVPIQCYEVGQRKRFEFDLFRETVHPKREGSNGSRCSHAAYHHA